MLRCYCICVQEKDENKKKRAREKGERQVTRVSYNGLEEGGTNQGVINTK